MTAEQTLSISVPGAGSITALRSAPSSPSGEMLIVYAPGAGSNLRDPFGAFLARELAAHGTACVRFQFPYQEAHSLGPSPTRGGMPAHKRRTPDRPAVLEATWRAVIATVHKPGTRVLVSGRSMGGRIASQVVAKGAEVAALALFAYPLHPPGRPDQARDAHLASIDVPTLFCSGARDAFASPEELKAAASKVPRSTVHILEGADHGFNVLKASGRTRPQVWAEAVEAMMRALTP